MIQRQSIVVPGKLVSWSERHACTGLLKIDLHAHACWSTAARDHSRRPHIDSRAPALALCFPNIRPNYKPVNLVLFMGISILEKSK